MVESWSLRQNRLLHSLYWGCLLLLCYIQMVKSVEKAPFAEVDVSGKLMQFYEWVPHWYICALIYAHVPSNHAQRFVHSILFL